LPPHYTHLVPFRRTRDNSQQTRALLDSDFIVQQLGGKSRFVRMETPRIQTRIQEDFSQVLAILLLSQMVVFEKVFLEQNFLPATTLDSRNMESPNDVGSQKKSSPRK